MSAYGNVQLSEREVEILVSLVRMQVERLPDITSTEKRELHVLHEKLIKAWSALSVADLRARLGPNGTERREAKRG